jgi:hypothetical protein
VTQFQAFLIVAAGFAAILCGFAWLARRVRRSGVGGGLMGPVDEIYRPTAQHVRHEIEAHEEHVVPLSAAGDLSDEVSVGRVRPPMKRVSSRRSPRQND